MRIIKVIRNIIIFIVIIITYKTYAMDKELILKIMEETLLLKDTNDNKIIAEKINEKLLDLKEIIQFEIKKGNPSVPIDIYLFLRGVINDDIYSLQSLLSQNENKNLSNDISKFINYSIAKKLAFALKENRIAVKTKIFIRKPQDKNNCDLYVNSNLLKNKMSFHTPAGVPIYIALYCKDNTFEIQKIRPGESQENQHVYFNHFIKRKNIPESLPNPNAVKNSYIVFHEKFEDLNKENNLEASNLSSNNIKTNKGDFQFGLGVGFLKDFGTLSNENVRNLKLPKGGLVYLSSYFNYKYFLTSLDYSSIHLREKQQIIFTDNNLKSEIKIEGYVNGNGHFIRPGMGIRLPIFSLSESSKIEGDFFTNITIITNKNASAFKMGYGVQSLIGPSVNLGSGFIFNVKFGVGYGFEYLGVFQLGAQMQLGYSF